MSIKIFKFTKILLESFSPIGIRTLIPGRYTNKLTAIGNCVTAKGKSRCYKYASQNHESKSLN